MFDIYALGNRPARSYPSLAYKILLKLVRKSPCYSQDPKLITKSAIKEYRGELKNLH